MSWRMDSTWQPLGVFYSDAISGVRMGWNKEMDEYLFVGTLLDVQKKSVWLTEVHYSKT